MRESIESNENDNISDIIFPTFFTLDKSVDISQSTEEIVEIE